MSSTTLRLSNSLLSENAYLLERLLDRFSAASVFNNHILRSRWDWQLNHKLSLRFILQYETVLSNPDLTLLETSKGLNGDFLLTYLVNPWTALYVGYNDNHRDLDLLEEELSRPGRNHRFLNDSRQGSVVALARHKEKSMPSGIGEDEQRRPVTTNLWCPSSCGGVDPSPV